MLTAKEQSLLDRMEPLAAQNGIEIVTIEIIGAKRSPVIRVYIDSEQGVSFNELSSAQAWIGELLDELDPFPGAYTLEVSSPGIDRPLRTPEHFKRFLGEEAKVRLCEPIEGQSNVKGTIEEVEPERICIRTEQGTLWLPLASIKRAHLIGTIEF